MAVSKTNINRKCREGKTFVFDSVVLGDPGKGLCEQNSGWEIHP